MPHASVRDYVRIIQGKVLWKPFWLLELWVVDQGEIPGKSKLSLILLIVSLAHSTVNICLRNITLVIPHIFKLFQWPSHFHAPEVLSMAVLVGKVTWLKGMCRESICYSSSGCREGQNREEEISSVEHIWDHPWILSFTLLSASSCPTSPVPALSTWGNRGVSQG